MSSALVGSSSTRIGASVASAPGDHESLAFSAAQAAELAIRELLEIESPEHVAHDLAIAPALGAEIADER